MLSGDSGYQPYVKLGFSVAGDGSDIDGIWFNMGGNVFGLAGGATAIYDAYGLAMAYVTPWMYFYVHRAAGSVIVEISLDGFVYAPFYTAPVSGAATALAIVVGCGSGASVQSSLWLDYLVGGIGAAAGV
jgi:hypothetical protein